MFKWIKSFFEPKKKVPHNGMRAYDKGFDINDNPFWKNTVQYVIWRKDYIFASQYPKVKKDVNIQSTKPRV